MNRAAVALVLCVVGTVGCAYDNYAQRGAMVGGVGGSLLGAAIGEASDQPLLGAAVGGLAGGLAGSAVGDGMDQDLAVRQANWNGATISPQAVTPDQLVAMTRNGLGDDVIVTHLHTHGTRFSPTADDLIQLKNAGVSDRVLAALQDVAASRAQAARTVQPVVVEEYYYAPGPRRYWRHAPYWHDPYCHPPHHFHHGGPSFGFSIHSH